MVYKRFLAIIISVLVVLFAFGCDNNSSPPNKPDDKNTNLMVDVIDVGQGDCILITFLGGDSLMIDCGCGNSYSNQNIAKVLTERDIDKIDYLVLTHPDIDHVGGASFVASKCDIGRVFLPYIYYPDNFPAFNNAVKTLTDIGVSTTYSTTNLVLADKANNYFIKFLSPANKDDENSSYNDINRVNPTDSQANNVSPIIYVQSQGVRMLFTGDAEHGQEEYVISNYRAGIYGSGANTVDLNDIDLLKVAHHGSNDSSSQNFLQILKPKNAVISVGGDNIYGHPITSVLERLLSANQNCNIFRTDYLGTISFTIKDGIFTRI